MVVVSCFVTIGEVHDAGRLMRGAAAARASARGPPPPEKYGDALVTRSPRAASIRMRGDRTGSVGHGACSWRPDSAQEEYQAPTFATSSRWTKGGWNQADRRFREFLSRRSRRRSIHTFSSSAAFRRSSSRSRSRFAPVCCSLQTNFCRRPRRISCCQAGWREAARNSTRPNRRAGPTGPRNPARPERGQRRAKGGAPDNVLPIGDFLFGS